MKREEQILTLEGRKQYEEELSYLVNVVRPQVTIEIAEARAQGDLSENADYDASKNKERDLEARIAYLENLLQNAKTLDAVSGNDEVTLGSKVVLKFLDEDIEETYFIVGSAEADPENGKISNACKLSQAILGHRAGETVTVKVDNPYEVTIKEIL